MDQIKLHKDCDDKRVEDYGFRKRKYKGNINYTLSVPLYFYKNIPVVEAQFIIFQSDSYVGYDVVNTGTNTLYSAFYNRGYSNPNENNVLQEVKNNINKELKFLKKSMIISKYEEVK